MTIDDFSTFAKRLFWAMETAKKTNQSELARAAGIKPQSVQYLLDPKRSATGSKHTPALARELGVDSDWLATGKGKPLNDANRREKPPVSAASEASSEKDWRVGHVRPLTWEELMSLKRKDDLPALFQVAAPDNSMAPRLRQGVKATFERDLEPQVSDGVLVRDSAGELHIRIYRRGRPGTWEAHALNDDFAPLVSDRDGLEVWAVLTAVEGRWS